MTAAVFLALLGADGALAYQDLNDDIDSQDVDGQLNADARPQRKAPGAVNVLLLGSDSRSGSNGEYGRDEGSARSGRNRCAARARATEPRPRGSRSPWWLWRCLP
ncbi:hypothetical protein [Streptomyces sp. AS02]|uniref:hypothetical protein n=1 Tax=Streptomyces sp. AS02 TaxID=2938946 RepID=UPI002021174C|nr:hypothetical protein [Streptomyces sp. AS02]MCL8010900.1 hypothetical protein [Streptomyces sp. AS02]